MRPGEQHIEDISPITNVDINIDPSGQTDPALLETVKDSGEISRRNLFGIMFGGAAAVGVLYFANRVLEELHVPNVKVDVGNMGAKPPVIEAKVDPLTFENEGTFEMLANSRIGVAVGVKGHKDGALWGFFGLTDAEYSKKIYGDFLLATDVAKINNSLIVERQGNAVLGVSATLNALDVFQPRVDFSDYRNQIDLNADDSQEKIDKKVKEYLADGSHRDPTGGFDCSMCDTDAIELVNGAYFLAQYAMTIDARQPDIIAEATDRYRRNMIQQLSVQYGIDASEVKVDVNYDEGTDPLHPPTPDVVAAIYKKRILNAYDASFAQAGNSIFDIKPELRQKDDGTQIVYTKMKGGAELTVVLSGITYEPEIRDLIIKNIQESRTVPIGASATPGKPDVSQLGPVGDNQTTTTNIWQIPQTTTGG